MNVQSCLRVALCLAVGAAVSAAALAQTEQTPDDVASAIAGGTADFTARYRYEFVDQDSFVDDANASTLLLRLNYRTGAWRRWTGFLEFDHVLNVVLDDFNSAQGTSSPRRNRYPVVADPNGADLNQLYLQYAPDEDWQVRIGRQRILLDDERYVGGVGWRQNEQTYDGVSVRYAGFSDTEIFYSYVNNVNRIFGSEVAAGDHEQDTHLLNVDVGLAENWNAIGYAYLIDNDDAPAFSTNTFGIRLSGTIKLGEHSIAVLGDIATQSDTSDNPASFDTEYLRLQAIWKRGPLSAGAGLESLGSDAGQGFRTPLATLHAFNGWADAFLATPGGGLDDLYLRVGYAINRWNLLLVYHDFSAETGGGDYGSEINFSASRRFADRYSLLIKAAAFDADDAPFVDATKLWVMLTANF